MQPASTRRAAADWIAYRERGSTIADARDGIRVAPSRATLQPLSSFMSSSIYFYLFAPVVRRHSRDYLRRALGREPRASDRFVTCSRFASTIHDRIYLLNGPFRLVSISPSRGKHWVKKAFATGHGAHS